VVSKEGVQEVGVPCGAVLVSAALFVAAFAMYQVATRVVEEVKAMAVVKKVISLVVCKGEMMVRWTGTDLGRHPFL
jgi:hypothetical protein